MATVQNIRDSLQLYLAKTLTDYVENTTDMVLLAMNNARKYAEKIHDFSCARVEAAIIIDVYSGAYLSAAWDEDDPEATISMRSIRNAFLTGTNGYRRPLVYTQKDTLVRFITDFQENTSDPDMRYPADYNVSGCYTKLVKNGNKLYLYPSAATEAGTEQTVYLDGYRWMLDYTADDLDYEDWFTQHGSDYLMWQSMVELNHLAKEFVSRQEGNLPPPTQQAGAALQNLISSDSADDNNNTEWEQY